MKKINAIIVGISCCLVFGAIALPIFPQLAFCKNATQKVLVVHSYHPEFEWVSTISRGIKIVFEPVKDIQLETIYMDTKRNTSLKWKIESGRRAREVISQWNPNVVITVDDNAQEYVGKFYAGKEYPKVVFCGVNNKAEIYGYPTSNITGVLERPHVKKTLKLLEKIIPGINKLAVISDNSPTSQGLIEYIKKQDQTLGKEVVAYNMPTTFSQWKSIIIDYQQQVDAIMVCMYHTVKQEGRQKSMKPNEIMKWTIANSTIPVVGFFNFAIDDGALLGVVVSGFEHGRKAALIALGILQGKSVQDFPVEVAEKGLLMYNKRTADKIGISINAKLMDQIDIIVGE